MGDEAKSFKELLDAAPMSETADTVSLVGALSRSSEAGKFVLTTSDGQATTFDVGAVKGHAVLAGAVGQTLVRVDLDAKQVPDSVAKGTSTDIRKLPIADITLLQLDHTALWDITGLHQDLSIPGYTDPIHIPLPGPGNGPDPGPLLAAQHPQVLHTVPFVDNTGFFDHSGILDVTGFVQDQSVPGHSDPIATGSPVDTPFLMATPHHASAAQIAALQGGAMPAGAAVAPFLFQTLPRFDHTLPFIDQAKRPTQDGTFGPHQDF